LQAQDEAQHSERQTGTQTEPSSYEVSPVSPILSEPLAVVIVEDDAAAEARKRREAEAEQREKDDLVAQQGMNIATQAMNEATQSMKRAAWWSFGAIAVGTALLIVTLHLTRQANKSARDAVAATREVGKAQVMAYLSIKESKAFIDDRDGIIFSVTVKNFGQSPARDAHAIASVWVNREIALPERMGGKTANLSVEVFSRSLRLGDIAAGETIASGAYSTHDLSFPVDVVRNAEGVIIAGPGSIGVFAKDVFGDEIFESDGVLVATGEEQFSDWERHGNFHARSLFGVFGNPGSLRARGWKEYETQSHKLQFEGGK